MQLDFFTKLTSWIRQDAPVAPATVATAKLRDDAELTARARALLELPGCGDMAARVRVQWNPRMRSTAGTANYAKLLVTLNPRLVEFGTDEVDQTLRHELAHLLARFRAGQRRIAPHGREWKLACRELGIADEKRCHNLPLPHRQVRRNHLYRCLSCGVEVRRVRPFRAKVACLSCCRSKGNGRYDDRFRLVKEEA